ncbi:glycosyltransferase 61 family protein [Anianabacter salinae]|uniref:glycosyltransferase 61 family protein n=1 Tax=Anianabacter salinae TaxID=2851023 RepID=UPI00225E6F24|nr:glycosyltransferase 61 family protein [Anianabacter salinae]MBV0912730.1 glycosyltransferase family 61 protein [Anianabacter salinae]
MSDPDSNTAPRPDDGWSREIVTVAPAVVVPPSTPRFMQPCGVLHSDGAPCFHGATWRFDRRMTRTPGLPDGEMPTLPGRWLWGGVLFGHFGHFLVESAARLWALPGLEAPVEGVVFIPKRPRHQGGLAGFQQAFLSLMQPGLRAEVVSGAPMRVEELVVPGQGFGLGGISAATPEMKAAFRDHFATGIAPEGPERLYVSRSKLGRLESGLIGEEALEARLAEEGYEVFHPQDHDIPTQIARYKAAWKIVMADGSAGHLFAYVGRSDQDVAYILRRDFWTEGPITQIEGFTGRAPLVLNRLSAIWQPKDEGDRQFHGVTLGVLDLPALGRDLKAAGFVSGSVSWTAVPDSDIAAAVQAAGVVDSFAPMTPTPEATGT